MFIMNENKTGTNLKDPIGNYQKRKIFDDERWKTEERKENERWKTEEGKWTESSHIRHKKYPKKH